MYTYIYVYINIVLYLNINATSTGDCYALFCGPLRGKRHINIINYDKAYGKHTHLTDLVHPAVRPYHHLRHVGVHADVLVSAGAVGVLRTVRHQHHGTGCLVHLVVR